jgi:hypothetical protein
MGILGEIEASVAGTAENTGVASQLRDARLLLELTEQLRVSQTAFSDPYINTETSKEWCILGCYAVWLL